MIPLEAISQTNEGFDRQMTSKELMDTKFPSTPRRRVVIVAGVIAVLTVVIVAASLIGKYVPDYIRDANSYCKSLLLLSRCSINILQLVLFLMLLTGWGEKVSFCSNSLKSKLLLEFSICIGFTNT